MSIKYDLIFSMGSIPLVASLLTALDLQLMEYPFDYVEDSNFVSRMELLISNFEGFLEKPENMVLDKDYEGQEGGCYKDTVTGLRFPEGFNVEWPIENTFPNAKQKYNKIIKRFRLKFKKSKTILFVYVENPRKPENEEANLNYMEKAINYLKAVYPNKKFNCLYIKNDEEAKEIDTVNHSESIDFFRSNFYTKSTELSMPSINTELLAMILAGLKLNTTWRQKKIILIQKFLERIIEFRNEHNL